jgi:ABC-type glycerol-3-phosphate transport system substrate-binding protein
MKLNRLLFCVLFGSLFSSASAETVIKILHLQSNPQIRAIWQEAAQQYESAHPGVKVQFDYLENEAFKAKLPTLLQSKDRPSAFHRWSGGVMYEQVNSGICKDITKEAPKETVDFMKVWLGKDAQTKLAAQGLFIPAVKGTADAIQDPLLKGIAQEIGRSQWIEIAMDQLLGPDAGRVMNDASADLASGNTTPEKAAKALEASWQQNKM